MRRDAVGPIPRGGTLGTREVTLMLAELLGRVHRRDTWIVRHPPEVSGVS